MKSRNLFKLVQLNFQFLTLLWRRTGTSCFDKHVDGSTLTSHQPTWARWMTLCHGWVMEVQILLLLLWRLKTEILMLKKLRSVVWCRNDWSCEQRKYHLCHFCVSAWEQWEVMCVLQQSFACEMRMCCLIFRDFSVSTSMQCYFSHYHSHLKKSNIVAASAPSRNRFDKQSKWH